MKRRISYTMLSIFLALFLTSSPSLSYDPEQAQVNLASDFAECTTYYLISEDALKQSGRDDAAREIHEASKTAFNFAFELSNEKVTGARIRLSTKEQMELIENDYSNFAILIEKYGEFCKALLEEPNKRLQYWLDRKQPNE